MKKLLIGSLLSLALLLVTSVYATQGGHQEVCFCHNLDNNPHTICTDNQGQINGHQAHIAQGKDSLGACHEPTVTPTVTQEPTATPTPTIILCDGDCITPTPTEEVTPTPTDTPRVTPEPQNDTPIVEVVSNTTSTPSCSDLKPVAVSDIWIENPTHQDGKVTLHWGTNANYSQVHIVYGFTPGDIRYSLLNTDNDGVEVISELDNQKIYWFSVGYVNGCNVSDYTKWIDPAV